MAERAHLGQNGRLGLSDAQWAGNGDGQIMVCVPVGASRRLRWGCLSLAAVVALLAVTTDPADARKRKRHTSSARQAAAELQPALRRDRGRRQDRRGAAPGGPDAPRHPASLTKIMTLYLLFERLEAGKISLDTPMPVSEEAASQAPTKLGLQARRARSRSRTRSRAWSPSRPTTPPWWSPRRSAAAKRNSRAMMTRKARALGMRNTVYRNASGLPNDEQITTARDQALLGIAVQERFPKYYRYFSTGELRLSRHAPSAITTSCSGEVEGVDGIKTGYTRASGFNLVTSVKRGANRHIVAVVLGGRSGGQRDARMRELIEQPHRPGLDQARPCSRRRGAPSRKTASEVRGRCRQPAPSLRRPPKPSPAAVAGSRRFAARAAGTGRRAPATVTACRARDAPIKPIKVKT